MKEDNKNQSTGEILDASSQGGKEAYKDMLQRKLDSEKKRRCPRRMKTIDDLDAIVEATAKFLELDKKPTLRMRETGTTAWAYIRKGYISCPWEMLGGSWKNRYAWLALMVHETVHFAVSPRINRQQESGHGKFFKEVEALSLAYWSLKADQYGKAYACRYRTLSGRTVWENRGRFNTYDPSTQERLTKRKSAKKTTKRKPKKRRRVKTKPMTLRKARMIWREVAQQHGFRADVETTAKAVLKPDDAKRMMKANKISTDYPSGSLAICVWSGIVIRGRTNPDKLRKSIEDWFSLLSLKPAA